MPAVGKKSKEAKERKGKGHGIFGRRGGDKQQASPSTQRQRQMEAAITIQAACRAKVARKVVDKKRRKAQKRQKYDKFNVGDVRNELAKNDMLPTLPSQMKR